MTDFRLVCSDCGVKWFVPSGAAVPDDDPQCAACGGELRPLPGLAADDRQRGWAADLGS